MAGPDPYIIVVLFVLLIAVFGGYYLYVNALRAGKEMDRLEIEEDE
jgi:hypothetical protein